MRSHQDAEREPEDAGREPLGLRVVLPFEVAHERRDQHGRKRTGGEELEEHVRDRARGLVGVAEKRGAQDRGDRPDPDEADPRDAAVAAPMMVAARVGGRTSPAASVTGACSAHAPGRGVSSAPDPSHPSRVMTRSVVRAREPGSRQGGRLVAHAGRTSRRHHAHRHASPRRRCPATGSLRQSGASTDVRGARLDVAGSASGRDHVYDARRGSDRPGCVSAASPPVRGRTTALVAQRIEHLTTDQKVGGSNPSERADRRSSPERLGRGPCIDERALPTLGPSTKRDPSFLPGLRPGGDRRRVLVADPVGHEHGAGRATTRSSGR